MKSPTERKRRGMDRSNMAGGETESNHGDDVSTMQIQALRSLFLLLVLAVTILVLFSSLAVLRKPKLSPNVNVFVDVATGNVVDDSARLKRGVENPLVHAAARRKENRANTVSQSKGYKKEQRIHKSNQWHKENVTKSVTRKDPNNRNITQVDIKQGLRVIRTHNQSENGTLHDRKKGKKNTKWGGPARRQEVTSWGKPRPSKYSSGQNMRGRGGSQ